MKIAIVGWGQEAKSAYNFFGPSHEYLIVSEQPQTDFPSADNVKVQFVKGEGGYALRGEVKDLSYLHGIENCDQIIYQPTAYFNLKKVYGDNDEFWSKATTAYDIFFENTPTKNIIGVTGTKGKGTTSTLIYQMLKAADASVYLGGNIGVPILDILPKLQKDDWVVWELANFQLRPAKHSPHIGVCLMISEEHLDWHPSFEDYIDAKANLFRYQTREDIAIYYENNEYSRQIAGNSPGKKIPFFEPPGARIREDGMIVVGENETQVIDTRSLKLIGKHNWQNVCAAVTAVWQISQNVEAMKSVLESFTGLEHRLEFVREVNGIKYYDDSFGTNPDTAVVALQALVQPVVLITGGYDRGISMEPLIKEILKDRVRHVVTIGQTGDKIAKMLAEKGFDKVTAGLKTMPEIVKAATQAAQAGDVILLSCAAASFDMFPNFEVRGDQFKEAVNSL